MVKILIVSMDIEALSDLISVLEEDGARIMWAESCEAVLKNVEAERYDLIITAEDLPDVKGLECIKKLISLNPMINCAAISSLSHKDFHEASEGLGVLMQLPESPGRDDAAKLLEHLNTILNLTKRTIG
jgi:DNA-binding NtrC family response regulator